MVEGSPQVWRLAVLMGPARTSPHSGYCTVWVTFFWELYSGAVVLPKGAIGRVRERRRTSMSVRGSRRVLLRKTAHELEQQAHPETRGPPLVTAAGPLQIDVQPPPREVHQVLVNELSRDAGIGIE